MKGLRITTLISKTPIDPRGSVIELFQGLPGQQVTIYRRKADSVFAGHFHKGFDPAKDPERFFIICGDVAVEAFDGKTNERFQGVVHANDLMIISKNIFHHMKALTDTLFLEYRSTVFDPSHPDTFPEKEYAAYIKNL